MKRALAVLACFLATLVLGSGALRLLSNNSYAASDSCCCSDPATVDPCVCSDHSDSEFPEIAAFTGSLHPAAPPAEEAPIEELAPIAGLLPRWHPARPWHAPPEEKRAFLSVWIL